MPVEEAQKPYSCEYCQRRFTSASSRYRHKRQFCRAPNKTKDEDEVQSEDDEDRVNDETKTKEECVLQDSIQSQLAATRDHAARLEAQVLELSSLVMKQQNVGDSGTKNSKVVITNVNNSTQNTIQQNNIVNIHPWDGARCINIGFDMIADVFAQNEKLHEYMLMGEYEMADPVKASPYVTELLMELIKRAHADPVGRNIYLNPNRTDQALILRKDSCWEVITLLEATKKLLDDVVSWTKLTVMSHEMFKTLPMAARSALACAGMHYEYEPEKYVKRIKGPMVAHLTNCQKKVPQPGTQIVVTESTLKPPPRKPDKIIPLGPAYLRSSYDPPVAYIPRLPDPTAKPRLNDERAAELLMRMRPTGDITVEYIKKLSEAAEEDADYVIKKLWEAVDNEYLKGGDADIAQRIVTKFDEDPDVFF